MFVALASEGTRFTAPLLRFSSRLAAPATKTYRSTAIRGLPQLSQGGTMQSDKAKSSQPGRGEQTLPRRSEAGESSSHTPHACQQGTWHTHWSGGPFSRRANDFFDSAGRTIPQRKSMPWLKRFTSPAPPRSPALRQWQQIWNRSVAGNQRTSP
jgi:hypothetical protein